jgi:hypothetical protein
MSLYGQVVRRSGDKVVNTVHVVVRRLGAPPNFLTDQKQSIGLSRMLANMQPHQHSSLLIAAGLTKVVSRGRSNALLARARSRPALRRKKRVAWSHVRLSKM